MKECRVKPGAKVRLKHWDPDDHSDFHDKEEARAPTEKLLARLDALQERLYAEGKQSLLMVLQGMDTAGKDGVIRHVMSGVSPQGCQVASFKVPSREESMHDFLWRVHQKAPPRGCIGIFNRSHYEDVLITRVHAQISRHVAHTRYKEINAFEKLLAASGTTIVKFFLHISKDEQRQRLQERVGDPQKRWKLSLADIAERGKWKDYQRAYEEAIAATSTEHAPWYIIPSNHKWYRNWAVARILIDTLEDMDPRFPPADPRIHFSTLKIK
jgi:PPK2 family polyphosphate:nucleotide phosphotransferase